jgi:hypothetical protein
MTQAIPTSTCEPAVAAWQRLGLRQQRLGVRQQRAAAEPIDK